MQERGGNLARAIAISNSEVEVNSSPASGSNVEIATMPCATSRPALLGGTSGESETSARILPFVVALRVAG